MAFRLRTLGEIGIEAEDGRVSPALQWQKPAALLVYLAFSPHGRSRQHLGELLWPNGKTAHSLNQALVPLRRALPAGAVTPARAILRLDRAALRVDVDDLRRLSGQRRWQEGAALIGGEFCADLSLPDAPDFEHWLSGERLRWRQLSVLVLASHAQERLDAGDLPAALEAVHRASDLDPLSEPALALSMRAMALAGQRVAALELYRRFAIRLREELGTEPSPETRALVQRLRESQPSASAATGAALPRRAPFIGRERPLARLLDGWRNSRRTRRASVATITGDAGAGKSRFAEEFLERARLEGAVITQARMVEADGLVPDSGLVNLARGGLLEAPGLSAADPAALAALQRAIPEWQGRFPPFDGTLPTLRSALTEAIRAVVEEHPVVLFVDDGHWADSLSLLGLGALLRDLASAPVLLLLALEPEPGREEIDRLRSRVGRDLAGCAMRLGPLDQASLQSLARWAIPGADASQLERVTRRLLADSAGLPLLAVELLHAVALGLDLGRHDRSWPTPFRTLTDTLPGDLPDAVVAAIRVNVRRLSPAAQQLLAAAAVLGDCAPRATLAQATQLPADQLDTALDALEWQRFLLADARGYSFVARIVRRVVDRDMVTRGQRERIRDRVGMPD